VDGESADGTGNEGCSGGDRDPAAVRSHRPDSSARLAEPTGRGYTAGEVGSSIDRWRGNRPVNEIRFVPARWLTVLLAVAGILLSGRRVTRLGVTGAVWAITPAPLKIAVAAVAATWMLVVLGALAAIVVLILQIS